MQVYLIIVHRGLHLAPIKTYVSLLISPVTAAACFASAFILDGLTQNCFESEFYN